MSHASPDGVRKTELRPVDVPIKERSDEQLVAALVAGDESALGELYDRYAEFLYRAALLRLGDRQLAEEVLQDTYLALWNRAELFDRGSGTVVGWLSAICRNRSIDRLRAAARRRPALPLSALLADADGDPTAAEDARDAAIAALGPASGLPLPADPQHELDISWLRTEVERALAGMPEHEREVIALAYYEELSQSEIAQRLDWPLGTVKTRTRRALGRLRESLADLMTETDGPR